MAILLADLVKWQRQPQRQGNSWRRTIKKQRNAMRLLVGKTPSLKAELREADWWSGVWSDAVAKASEATGLADFPEACPWSLEKILDETWLPRSLSEL